MASWTPKIVRRVRELAANGHVRLTHKALYEMASLGMDQEDVLHLLQHLDAKDCTGRVRSSVTSEWLYVFKPTVAVTTLYVKIALRQGCIVVSLHEDMEDEHDRT
jgi:phosphomevalonate kinase